MFNEGKIGPEFCTEAFIREIREKDSYASGTKIVEIMKNENIYKEWEKFINEYKKIL